MDYGFVINNFWLLIFLIIGIVAFFCYKRSKNEMGQKIINRDLRAVFSKKEYKEFKECGETALNNTTVSFSAEELNNQEDQMNLYYCTVLVGNHIMKSGTFTIADVGEIE